MVSIVSTTEQALEMVSIKRLYNHILALEGVRHPLDSPKALIQTGDYIETAFKKIGLNVEKHPFVIKGFDSPFFNIVGHLHPETENRSSILVTSHYDTVYSTPGADDNASAVALMLEIARILKRLDYKKKVIFISFNLEEYSPYIQRQVRELGVKHGVYDESYRFVSWSTKKCYDQYKKLISTSGAIKPFLDEKEWNQFESSVKWELSDKELDFFRKWNQLHRETGKNDPIGSFAILGSNAYSKKVVEKKIDIEGVINLEMVGYTSSKPHSQSFPPSITLETMDKYKIDEENMIGDFVTIYLNLAAHNTILATIVMVPIMVAYVLTVIEWVRAKD